MNLKLLMWGVGSLFLLSSAALLPFAQKANAHQNGCHRWRSCPSDWGTYTCVDTGHSNYCPQTPSLYDRYMVLGCNAQKAGDWNSAKAHYNSALIASRTPEKSRQPYPNGKPLSFYAEESIAGKNLGCKP